VKRKPTPGSFQKGHAKLPGSGMKKGQKTERGQQWEALGELITGRLTDKVTEYIDTLPPEKMFTAYLQLLEYFKPKLTRSEIKAEVNPVIAKIKTVYDEIQQEPGISQSGTEAG
jgi:hypothetical protein